MKLRIIFLCSIFAGFGTLSAETKPAPHEFWRSANLIGQVYGGINYATKSSYASAVETVYGSDNGAVLSPAFGVTLWYGNSSSQLGISGGYQVTYKNNATIGSATNTTQLTQVPVAAYARYFPVKNLYVGLGLGASINLLKISGATATTYTAVSPLAALRVGYDYEIATHIFVGGAVNFSYFFWTVSQAASGGGASTDYSASALSVQPLLSVAMTF